MLSVGRRRHSFNGLLPLLHRRHDVLAWSPDRQGDTPREQTHKKVDLDTPIAHLLLAHVRILLDLLDPYCQLCPIEDIRAGILCPVWLWADIRCAVPDRLSGWGRWSEAIPETRPELARRLHIVFALIQVFLVGILYGPLGEEFGWRGFALPRLQRQLGALLGSLVLGVIWSAWHLPLHLVPELNWTVGNTPLIWFFLLGAPWSIFFSWLYNNTEGSVLLAILLHASINFSMGVLRFTSPRFYPAITIVFWAVALLVVVVFGPQKLSRKNVDLAFYIDEAGE